MNFVLHGVSVSAGITIGRAHLVSSARLEAAHYDTQPRGVLGEQQLTLGTVQATLDLWQSADLRSYVRLRTGPGVEVRVGPWGDTARFVGFAPATTLEGNLMLGRNTLQQLNFALRGDVLRSVSRHAQPLPGDWALAAQAAYEAVVVAINDQPVTLRLVGGTVSGEGPCGSYTGTYASDGRFITLRDLRSVGGDA